MKLLRAAFKFLFITLLLLLVFVAAVIGVDAIATRHMNADSLPDAERDSYLIHNVHLLPMTSDTILRNHSILIKDGKISAMGPELQVAGITEIDGGGGYLLPGLIDMHIHLWDRYELGLYLSSGVTAVRNVWGMPMHLRIKEAITKGELMGPVFFTTGPKLTGREFIGDDNMNLNGPEKARIKVAEFKESGYDFLKTYYGLDKDIFEALLEAASKNEMDIVAHASNKVPYNYHMRSEIISLEHVEDIVQRALDYKLDSLKLQEVISDFKQSPHTAFCPTMMAFYNISRFIGEADLLQSEDALMMNASIRRMDGEKQLERWQSTQRDDPETLERILGQHDFHLYIIQKLHEAGVLMICGTDAGIGVTVPGKSLHREMAFYRAAGLSNFEVLQTATINPSKTHKTMAGMGSLQVGKLANLILVRGNPLEDLEVLSKPEQVWVAGRSIGRSDLDKFETKARDRSNFLVTALRYAEHLNLTR